MATSFSTLGSNAVAAGSSAVASGKAALSSGMSSLPNSLSFGTATQSTDGAAGNSNNVPNFVDNVWIAGADDKLAAQDIYNAPTNDVVNDTPLKPTTMDSWADSIRGSIKSLASNVRTISSVIKSVKAAEKALKSGDFSLAARALGDNKALQSAFSNLNLGIDPSTIKSFQDAGKLAVKVGDVYKTVKATNFNDINSIGKLVGQYTKDNNLFKISDLGADVAKACTIANACLKNGVPNSIPMALNVIGADGPVKQFVAGTLSTVIRQSDVDALRDLSKAVEKSGLSKINPNLMSDVSKVFSNPVFNSLEDKTAHYDNTITTFTQINDNWCRNTIGSDQTLDLTVVTRGSDDFKSLIAHGSVNSKLAGATGTSDDKLLGFGTVFDSTSVVSELNNQFPATVVNSATVTKSSVTNPVFGAWGNSLTTQ